MPTLPYFRNFSSQGAVGRAVVSVNSEDEVSFSISDSAGRTVMSGKLNNYKGSGATAVNTLASWSTQLHDNTASLSGYGTVLESKSIDAQGYATRTWTDAAGRTLKSFDQLDKATTVTYDAAGNQLTVRDANNVGADMVYDVLGRNTQRTDTASAVTKTAYDKAGNAIKQTDAKNNDTFITFDARGRRKQTTDRISATTTFTFTALGQQASLTDAQGQTTSYTYSDRGEKLTETYPDHSGGNPGDSTYGIVTFVYDNAGRLLRKQDQLGDTCTFNYDLAGRMTSRNYRTKVNSPSGTIADSDTFTYNRIGAMLTAVSGRYSNTVTYTYDLVGRKATEALTTNSQTYTIGTEYNTRGELVKYTYPDSSIQERTYHATGALNLLKLDGNTVSTRSYDDGTRLTGETLGNGVTETRAYANDNLLTSITFGGTGTAIGNLSYTWDANKNKTSETIGGTMADWGFTSGGTSYDDEDRLTGYARAGTSSPSQLSQSWSLTSVGDWSSTTINGTAHTRTHGPTHELLTNKIGSASAQSVTTDVKGNMTSIPANLRETGATTALNLVWDFDNRMKSADINADSTPDVTFTYDALGRRVTRSHSSGSWVFVQAGQQTLCDYVIGQGPSNALYRYVYASYIDEPVVRKQTGTGGTILYYHRNQQYSIYAMTNSSGSVVERYAYTAYGQPTVLNASASVVATSAYDNRYTYTSREWDHTVGLHYFRARWMSGLSGRFTGRDPLGFADGFDLYSLMQNHPLHGVDWDGLYFKDPSGEWCCEGDKCKLGIGMRAPCRPVRDQIKANLKANRPAMQGVVTGHAWIYGDCNKKHWISKGIYTHGPNPMDGPIDYVDEPENVKKFGFTHLLELDICSQTLDCIARSLEQFEASLQGQDPPRYCAIDPYYGGKVNCSGFVRDRFIDCGISVLGTIFEPYDFSLLPGVSSHLPCLKDTAAP